MLDEARAGADRLLAEKLADIALVYRDYLAFLDTGYVDESGVLAGLPAAMEERNVAGANVVFAGFSSFTRQAAEGIFAALRIAKSVSGVFIGGEEELYTNEAVNAFEKYCRMAGAQCERVARLRARVRRRSRSAADYTTPCAARRCPAQTYIFSRRRTRRTSCPSSLR